MDLIFPFVIMMLDLFYAINSLHNLIKLMNPFLEYILNSLKCIKKIMNIRRNELCRYIDQIPKNYS